MSQREPLPSQHKIYTNYLVIGTQLLVQCVGLLGEVQAAMSTLHVPCYQALNRAGYYLQATMPLAVENLSYLLPYGREAHSAMLY